MSAAGERIIPLRDRARELAVAQLELLRAALRIAEPVLAELAEPRPVEGYEEIGEWHIRTVEPAGVALFDTRGLVSNSRFYGATLYYIPSSRSWMYHERDGVKNVYEETWFDEVQSIVGDETVIENISICSLFNALVSLLDDNDTTVPHVAALCERAYALANAQLELLHTALRVAEPDFHRIALPWPQRAWSDTRDCWTIQLVNKPSVCLFDTRALLERQLYTGVALYYEPARGWWLHERRGVRDVNAESSWQDVVVSVDESYLVNNVVIHNLIDALATLVDDATHECSIDDATLKQRLLEQANVSAVYNDTAQHWRYRRDDE